MKNIIKALVVVLVVACVSFLPASISDYHINDPSNRLNYYLSFEEQGPLKISIDSSYKLHLNKDINDVTYKSSRSDIVSVDSTGLIETKKLGSSIITATSDDEETELKVVVKTSTGFVTQEQLDSLNLDKYDNLMVVAHPDDETLWGGAHLKDSNYFVVCLTNADNNTRKNEFLSIINYTKNKGIILGYPDTQDYIRDDWEEDKQGIISDLEKIINYKKWNTIVTHSPDGGTGHMHHKMTSQLVYSIVKKNDDLDKLYYFGPYYRKNNIPANAPIISSEELKFKYDVLKLYKSVNANIGNIWYHMIPYERFVSEHDWNELGLKSESTYETIAINIPTSSIAIKGLSNNKIIVIDGNDVEFSVTNPNGETSSEIIKKLNPTIDVRGLRDGNHYIDLALYSNYVFAENKKVLVHIISK